ncbi:hypothetical protein [Tsuneonella sp. HG222]
MVALDGEGVTIIARSGDQISRFRVSRSWWRKYLEREIRRLAEYEIIERAERGRILPFKKEGNGHH